MTSQFFRSDSNFGIKIQNILAHFKDGLSPEHIIRELRKTGTHVYGVNSIMSILEDRKYFVKLSGNMYCLKSSINAFSDAQKIEEPFIQEQINEGDTPLIINLPHCLSDYIIFDLETTGFDPEKNSIIQIAALKVINNEPSDFINLYVNPYPDVLSQEIKNILNLTADIEEEINGAPSVKIQYEAFRLFCGNLPLIAHNVRFDFSFLKAVDPSISNMLLDTMELALLTFPGIESYRLEELVKYFDIKDSDMATLADRFSINGFSRASFHDARVDVLYLYMVYVRLLNEFLSGNAGRIWSRFFKDINPIILQPDNQDDIIKIHTGENLAEEELFLTSSEETCFALLDKYLHEKSYEKREGQIEMMKLVFKSLKDGLVKMIEAPTGTGKTIAYIIPSVVFSMAEGKKVSISTAVKNLQDQLMEDLADFSIATGLTVNYQLLKGRNSYVCIRKLRNYVSMVSEGHLSLQELICLAYLVSWVNHTREGTLDELNYWMESRFPVLKELKKEITSDASSCAGKDCNCCHECFRKRAYDRAVASNIIIINHSLWLSEPEDLPKFDTLILDEAHNLEDAATSAFTEEVSADTWNVFFESIINPKTGRGFAPRLMAASKDGDMQRTVGALFSACKISGGLVRDLGNHFRDFIKSCSCIIDEKYGASLRLEREPEKIEPLKWKQVDGVRKQLNFYLKEIQNILEKLKLLISSSDTLPYKDEFLLNLASVTAMFLENYSLFNDILKVNNIKKVYWLEVEEREHSAPFWALKCAPLDISELLTEKYSRLSSIILTSATLSIKGGDFSFFSSRLGLDERLGKNNTHIVSGGIDYSRAFLALTSYLNYIPSPSTMERFKEEMSEELKRFLSFTDGKALVLFNSRERMEYSYNLCSPCLEKAGIPVYCQRNGISKKAIQKEFSLNKNSVLMGLKSFWEGIDVPGEALSFVIMEKLPFPFVFDPLYRARREEFADNPSKGHEFEDYIFPLMAIRFKQGFGRLLRREDDRGAVLLLDRRIHKKSYKYDLLASLPGYTRDDEAENDRKSLYLKIAEFLPGLIDVNSKKDFLDTLPDELLINIQKKLNKFELPRVMSQEEYDRNRHKLKEALKEIFGYDDFRSPEQEKIVRAILTGKDVTGVLSTGSGKSLCFQLPALLRKGTTIVFSPLIALMKDQFESLKEKGIELIDCIYSGQRSEEREEIFRRMKEGKCRLVYISPERLRDGQLLECIKHTDIINIIVDEAHCIDMWGAGFRPDYLYIAEIFRKTGVKPPVAAFTATATEETKCTIARSLEMEDPLTIQGTFDRPELNFIVYNSRSLCNRIKNRHDKFNVLMKILKRADLNRESALIYVSTTVEADQLARKLRITGFDIRSYHGRMNSQERDSVQEMFMDGHINMVVCTKAFGMGIDKKDIRYVIHYNVPGDIESYFQETGRAGRDGKESYCILLYHGSDLRIQRFFNNSVIPQEHILIDVLLYIKNNGDDTVYLNPRHIVTSLDIEESELKVALHILEVQGFIVRDMDFTVNASLILLETSENILNFVRDKYPDDFNIIYECFKFLSPLHYRKINASLLELSNSINKDMFSIEQTFIRLALEEKIVFRPWEKGITVRLTQKGKDEQFTCSSNGENPDYQERLNRKLDVMTDYASKNKICRRKQILGYFGEDYLEDNCGKCDVCAPEKHVPWSEMTERDIPEIYDFFDPAFTILELLKWNSELKEKPARSPYGKKTLTYILTGNDYVLLFKEEDQKKKLWKRKIFRQCPYFAILDRVPGKENTIERLFERLFEEGYIEYQEKEYGTNGNTNKYTYPVPTVKGYERLESGELLGW